MRDSSVTLSISGNGRDDDKFEIVDGKLRIKTSADFEVKTLIKFSYQQQTQSKTTLRSVEIGVTDQAESVWINCRWLCGRRNYLSRLE